MACSRGVEVGTMSCKDRPPTRQCIGEIKFRRSFRAATGLAPHELQRDLRLRDAMRLFSTSANKVISVPLDCGFDNAAYFSTWFQRQTGMTPTRYRAQVVAS